MTITQNNIKTIDLEHIEQTDFYYLFTELENKNYVKKMPSCGCSTVEDKEDGIVITIKADKIPAVVDNVPARAYANGKTDYTKSISVTFEYADESKFVLKLNIKVTEV